MLLNTRQTIILPDLSAVHETKQAFCYKYHLQAPTLNEDSHNEYLIFFSQAWIPLFTFLLFDLALERKYDLLFYWNFLFKIIN